MELRTERLVLRPLDRTTIRNMCGGIIEGPALSGIVVPDGWPMNGLMTALPVMFNDLADDRSSFGWHAWALIDRKTMRLLGDAGFKGPPDEGGSVEIGFSILPEERNKGYAKEAVRALLDHAFASGKVRTIIAECEEGNVASMKVLEGSGMRKKRTSCHRVYWEIER